MTDTDLWQRAVAVLKQNRLDGGTKAAPRLYPHQWSWDSAFIAIGLARIDPERALQEMQSLLRGQWRNGMIPHIIFDPEVGAEEYFPGADRWACADVTPDAPAGVATSGLVQPPVHAIAIQRAIAALAAERRAHRAREFFTPLFEWHRYLLSVRDPEGSGLVTIVHPWESGMDNSPRWTAALESVTVDPSRLASYERADLKHVNDASQRPTQADYDRYLWIVDRLIDAEYRVDAAYQALPFLMKDVLFSALLVAANEALLRLASIAAAPLEQVEIIESWIDRGRRGLARQWDDTGVMCCDRDLVGDRNVLVRTLASFSPLVAGNMNPARRAALLEQWRSEAMVGHPELRWPLPPSTSPLEPEFSRRMYWRGPVWPVMNWLFAWALRRSGAATDAAALTAAGLDQIREIGFAEYAEPFTGESLGSREQSWTAAIALDWLAESVHA
jgi:glucosylglycerate hydrolase